MATPKRVVPPKRTDGTEGAQPTPRSQIGVMGLAQPVIQGVALIVGFALAHNLHPRDYGVVAMATGFTGMLTMLAGFGLSDAAVQRKDLSDQQASALFWLNLLAGALLGGVAVAAGPLLGHYFDEPAVPVVAAWAGLSVLLNTMTSQHRVHVIRQARYGTLALVDLITQLAAGIAAISVAVAGYGWWALVALFMVQASIRLVGSWSVARWWPVRFRMSQVPWDSVQLGMAVCSGWLLNSLVAVAESMALGKLGGATELGLYNRAMQLARYPIMIFFIPAFLPAVHRLGKRHADMPAMAREQVRMLSWVLLLISLPLALLVGEGTDLVPLLMGEQWQAAVPLLSIAAVGIAGHPVAHSATWALTAVGSKRGLVAFNILASGVPVLAAVGGALLGGAMYMCGTYSAAMWFVLVPLGVRATTRALQTSRPPLLLTCGAALLLTLVTSCATWAGAHLLAHLGVETHLPRALGATLFGALTWLTTARMTAPDALREVCDTLATTAGLDRFAWVGRALRYIAPA